MTTTMCNFSGCTIDDSAAIARNNVSAFWEDPHYRASWSHRTLEEHITSQTTRMADELLFKRENKRHQKAVDPTTGALLGYARWDILPQYRVDRGGQTVWPEAILPAVSEEEEAEYARLAGETVWDSRGDDLEEELRAEKQAMFARQDYMRLDYLAVHPDNQGKGIATRLVQNGMVVAAELGLDVFIHAYEAGLGLYMRLGFRIEKTFVFNDTRSGGPGDYSVYLMVYSQPKS